jgi:act minimal PKS acyl carrier protein
MAIMDINGLFGLLMECAGANQSGELTDGTLDIEFEDLGYDSLALMEAAAIIRQRTGVVIPDESIANVRTPRNMLDLVNGVVVETR